jgi:hypothetical protein
VTGSGGSAGGLGQGGRGGSAGPATGQGGSDGGVSQGSDGGVGQGGMGGDAAAPEEVATICATAGEKRCNSDVLESCSADRTTWLMQKCEFGCDADKRACRPCAPAGQTCASTTELRVCDADGVRTMNCPAGCNMARNACNLCTPNENKCNGNNLEVCDATGANSTTMPCESGCTGNACNECKVGRLWCVGTALFHCPEAKPVEKEQCKLGCAGDRCAICAPGSKLCEGPTGSSTVLSTCDPMGLADTKTSCEAGCNEKRNECNVCRPGSKVCKDGYLEECRADGSGWIRSKCELGCVEGVAQCRVCAPNVRECHENRSQLWTCNASGSAWLEMKNCGDPQCNPTSLMCNLCRPNAKSCAGKALRTCNAQGTAFTDQACADPTPDDPDTEARGVGSCDSGRAACTVSCESAAYLRCPVPGQTGHYVCRQAGRPGFCNCFRCPGWADLCETDLCGVDDTKIDVDHPTIVHRITCNTQKGELKVGGTKAIPSNPLHQLFLDEYPCTPEQP